MLLLNQMGEKTKNIAEQMTEKIIRARAEGIDEGFIFGLGFARALILDGGAEALDRQIKYTRKMFRKQYKHEPHPVWPLIDQIFKQNHGKGNR